LPKVHIVDTLNASLGVFLCANKAAAMVKIGCCAKKTVDYLLDIRHKIGTYIVPQNLTYLKKGGRVNTVSAIVGTLLGIRPIITIVDGWGRNFGVCRNEAQVYQKLSKFFIENTQGDKQVFITHANCYQKAQKLMDTLNQKVSNLKITVSEMGSVMGTHVGPGSVGIYFIQKHIHKLN
jgi:DegV family protein with EDD domain